MPKAFTNHEKDLIGKRLLDQGYKLFSAYGLKKTSVEELAQAAGISKGAFYLFYESKEALFLDVAELVEQHFRNQILAAVDLPGPSPRARLYTILKKVFSLLKTLPLLQFLTSNDFDLLMRRVPPEKFHEHLANDQLFLEELVTRCKSAGIPILVKPEEIAPLLYPFVLSVMHGEDYIARNFGSRFDLLLELVAAYCLGEVEVHLQQSEDPSASAGRDSHHEPGD